MLTATVLMMAYLAEVLGESEYTAVGTATGTTTTQIDTDHKYEEHEIDGKWIWWSTGSNAGQCRKITSYVPSTGTITFAPAVDNNTGSDSFQISSWTLLEWQTALITSCFRAGVYQVEYDYQTVTQPSLLEYDIPRRLSRTTIGSIEFGEADAILTDVALQRTTKHDVFADQVVYDPNSGSDVAYTDEAKSEASDDVVFTIGAVNDALEIGLYQPFDEIEIDLSTAANIVGTLQVQYYTKDGWVNLATDHDLDDDTNSLTQSGTIKWTMPRTTWYPLLPSADLVSLETRLMYFIRIVCTAWTSTTTSPLIQRIKIKTCESYDPIIDYENRDTRVRFRDTMTGGRIIRMRVLVPIGLKISGTWPPANPLFFNMTQGQQELVYALAAKRMYRLLLQRVPADLVDRVGKLYAMWTEEARDLMITEGQSWEDMNLRRP